MKTIGFRGFPYFQTQSSHSHDIFPLNIHPVAIPQALRHFPHANPEAKSAFLCSIGAAVAPRRHIGESEGDRNSPKKDWLFFRGLKKKLVAVVVVVVVVVVVAVVVVVYIFKASSILSF